MYVYRMYKKIRRWSAHDRHTPAPSGGALAGAKFDAENVEWTVNGADDLN